MTTINTTAVVTVTKATATTLVATGGYQITSPTKGVVGQFDKVINLINKLPEGEFVIEASKIKGVFKALKENSKDCTTFSFVLACNGWGLEPKGDNSWVICRPEGNITLINGSYIEPTQQPEEVEMEAIENDFNFKYLPFKEQADINCLLLSIGGKTFPQSLNDIEDSIARVASNEDESIQLTIRELEAFLEEYRPSQIKEKVVTVSEVTQIQPEEVKVKPKTFCQLLREEWLPSRESWIIDTLKRKMRATWKARKELTCERQGKFMAEFFRRLDVYSPNTELPLQAFLTTYDLVKEDMTGQKTQIEVPVELKPVQKDHNTEEVKDAYTNHLNNLLNKFPERSIIVAKESVCSEETQEELRDETNDSEEELSEGKVTIKTMLGDTYTIEVFYNNSKTLWINTRSGESFSSLFDLCMVHDKEYFNHEFFVEGQPSADTTTPQHQLGDILAVTYDDEHNEYAYYGSDLITVKVVVVQNGFQLGEGEDAEVFATIHELCNKASNGNYEGTPEVKVVTEDQIEAILEKEYNVGMGIE